jgi:cell division protein FtsB
MVDMGFPAIDRLLDQVQALRADNARLSAERDAAREERDILQAELERRDRTSVAVAEFNAAVLNPAPPAPDEPTNPIGEEHV